MMTYRDHPGVNPSSLKKIALYSPRHYRYLLDHPTEPTDALRFGSAVHAAVLQPDVFAATYTSKPEGMRLNTIEGKAWLAQQGTREVLTADDFARITWIHESLRSHPTAGPLLAKSGAVEEPVYWLDPDFGVACKGRPDLVTCDGELIDLKTTTDLRPHRFAGDCAKYGYHFSHAFYHDGLTANLREPRADFIIAVESRPPFDVVVYRLVEALEVGRDEYKRALEKYVLCRDANRWPGVADDAIELRLPKWALSGEESDDVADYREGSDE